MTQEARELVERLRAYGGKDERDYRHLAAATITTLLGKMEEARVALDKIDAIRNSIIGFQNVGWSEHIYPLVAALGEAGYQGAGYEKARESVRTLLAAEARAEAAEARADKLAAALEPFASFGENNTDDEGWAGTECQRERIVDWFGPSDFRTARSALADKGVANG